MAEKQKTPVRSVIIPRTNEGYKELFAVSGSKKIPFGVPVYLTEQDILQIENQKEAVKSSGPMNPYDFAREKGVSIDQAMDMIAKSGDMTNVSELQWMPKYTIQTA